MDNALRREDIEGLLELGAPQDEYSRVAQIITDVLLGSNAVELTEENIMRIVTRIWMEQFSLDAGDTAMRLPAIRRAAQQIVGDDP